MGWWEWIFERCPAFADKCQADWEAWAVGAAVVGIMATVFLGLMTLRLGKAANAASEAALRISLSDSAARKQRDHDERLILLMRVNGEVAIAVYRLRQLEAAVARPIPPNADLFTTEQKARFYHALRLIQLREFGAISDRLHILGNPLAAQFARAVKILEGTWAEVEAESDVTKGIYPTDFVENLRVVIPIVIRDLAVVLDAGRWAVHELGIDDANVVAAAENLGRQRD